jgi:rhamnulose-1-phosphate aldolase/alcohol dehydrogenase
VSDSSLSTLASRADSEVPLAGDSERERLVERSRRLGADPRVTNFGGGNTSAKLPGRDPVTGEPRTVLVVKGSGGDLGSIRDSGFAELDLGRLLALEGRYRGLEHEDEMVALLDHCRVGVGGVAPSIDTPLHAYLPFAHVDHVHPDGVIALATARRGEELTGEVYGDAVGWLPWQRPGFDLALRLRDLVRARPGLRGVVLGGHGLICWGEDAESCYRNTLELVDRAEAWLAERGAGVPAFGGPRTAVRGREERADLASRLMPLLRGRLSGEGHRIGHFCDADEVLEFTTSARFEELAALGTSCPDHFLRTKVRPLVLPASTTDLEGELDRRLEAYRAGYRAYYERQREPDSPALRGAEPVITLLPGVGLFSFAPDCSTARIASEFYRNAIRVMRGATAVDEYVGLSEREAFRIEYWGLEQAKLDRRPAPRPLEGRVALITGGAGGIGRATAERLISEGACVVLADRNGEALEECASDLVERHGADRVRRALVDVRQEAQVAAAFGVAAREYGGVDIVVSNAGLASASPVEETSLESWNESLEVMATGYFLVAREAMRLLRRQGLGGAIVFVGSKNALAASGGAAAYGAAKAAELHLARSLALEGAPHGIRVNTVNPDAVLEGSRIWQGEWRRQRAEAYGVEPEELEEYYRRRSLLGVSVTPADVAEAICFLASERSSRTTGALLNVDGGNAAAFPR